MIADKPFYDEWVDYTVKELQNIFWKYEKAFDYIVKIIKTLKYENFTIVIENKENGNLLFVVRNAEEFTDGSNLGYTKDELFEQYVNDILVGEKLSKIEFVKGYPYVCFGHNFPIFYKEGAPAIENTNWNGSLKENWFYRIQTYE